MMAEIQTLALDEFTAGRLGYLDGSGLARRLPIPRDVVRPIYADLTAASPPAAVSAALIDHITALNAIHGPRGPVALVVGPSAVGTTQRYAWQGEQARTQRTEIFWNRQDAVEWLDRVS